MKNRLGWSCFTAVGKVLWIDFKASEWRHAAINYGQTLNTVWKLSPAGKRNVIVYWKILFFYSFFSCCCYLYFGCTLSVCAVCLFTFSLSFLLAFCSVCVFFFFFFFFCVVFKSMIRSVRLSLRLGFFQGRVGFSFIYGWNQWCWSTVRYTGGGCPFCTVSTAVATAFFRRFCQNRCCCSFICLSFCLSVSVFFSLFYRCLFHSFPRFIGPGADCSCWQQSVKLTGKKS